MEVSLDKICDLPDEEHQREAVLWRAKLTVAAAGLAINKELISQRVNELFEQGFGPDSVLNV